MMYRYSLLTSAVHSLVSTRLLVTHMDEHVPMIMFSFCNINDHA